MRSSRAALHRSQRGAAAGLLRAGPRPSLAPPHRLEVGSAVPPVQSRSPGLQAACTGFGLPGGARRGFFGIGEVLGVISNPSEVLRSLTESKKLLEEARQELKEAQERSQIPPSHTFSPLPGFFERPNEIKAIERALGSIPTFTVLFGASSVGKTALLRQVLSSDRYHVLHFDLRIAGFADLSSLYFSLSTQLESYFAAIPDLLGKEWGWGEFEKESWAFKHDRAAVQKRIEQGGEVKSSNIAHLLELFQSALLNYWSFEPMSLEQRKKKEEAEKEDQADKDAKDRKDGKKDSASVPAHEADPTEARLRQGSVPAPKPRRRSNDDLIEARSLNAVEAKEGEASGESVKTEEMEREEELKPPPKRIPVFFLDEAHKLPALIQSVDTMKTFLDSSLVLSKQDRLCHILHASSDAFYLHWLRSLNVMQHCVILTMGDPAKEEAHRFYNEVLAPHIPDHLQSKISFDKLYPVFGGKLAHLSDYVAEFVNSEGAVSPHHSSHFLQAHSLLNLHLIHSMPTVPDDESSSKGFHIYSSLRPAGSPHASPSPFGDSDGSEFRPADLLTVMKRLQPGAHDALPYFPLCRELGARAVDGLVRGRILELRWSGAVTEEGEPQSLLERQKHKVVGPVVLPTTPVCRYAMGQVLKEYEEEGFTIDRE